MDPKVNGQIQNEWGWLVAVYLFLGGVGGGAYTIAAINGFMGEGAELSTARIGGDTDSTPLTNPGFDV